MAKLECHYFPDTPASWQCPGCHALYSDKCIPAGHSALWGRRGPYCIRCEKNLMYLGSATGAKPFWQMLPHFFTYPLHPNSLLVMGLLMVLSLLLFGGLLALVVLLFGLALLVKYGLKIIEFRGRGVSTPPGLGEVLGGDEHHLFFRQMALFFMMGVINGLAYYLNAALGVLVTIFITLAMPASIMILAVEKSVRRALDPLALIRLMFTVGWPYLLLWLCTQIISAGPVYALEFLLQVLPGALVLPVIVGISVYFTFVLYTMLGYVLFEYQRELGLDTEIDDDHMEPRDFEKARALGATRVLIKEGDYARARTLLRKALDAVPDDVELHQHYHRLLMLLDDDQALVNHATYFVELAARQQQLSKAVPVVLDVQQRVPGFQLADTRLSLDLARLLELQRQPKALVRLFHNRHKTHADDPLLPDAYGLVARVLYESLNEDAKAQALLNFLLKKYPQHPQHQTWLKLHQQLQAHLGSGA